MGSLKHYYLRVLEQCSDQQTGQDAIEWAIVAGMVTLSYDLEADVRSIMARYDDIIAAYQAHLRREEAHAWSETLNPIPLAA